MGNRKTIALIVLSIVLGGFVAWQAKPIYDWYQEYRALSLVEKSTRFLDEQRIGEAADAARRAYLMAPEEPEVIRSLARLYRLDGSAAKEALYLLQKLVGMNEATSSDRREIIRTLAVLGQIEEANLLASELMLEDPKDPETLSLKARLLISNGEIAEGMKYLRRAEDLAPGTGSDRDRLLLAQLYLEFGSFEEKSSAWMMLKEISRLENATGTKALELLDRNFTDGVDLHPILLNPPAEEKGPQPAYLTMIKRQILLEPERKDELLNAAFDRFREMGAPARYELNIFARWAFRQGHFQILVNQLDWNEIRNDEGLAPVYLNALGKLNDWARVKELLEDESGLALNPIHVNTYLAYCAEKLDLGYPLMQTYLREALKQARREKSYRDAISIGSYAERFYFFDVARQSYRFATRAKETAKTAFELLLAMDDIRTNGEAQRTLTREFLERYPDKVDLQQRYLYLKLLLGLEVELAQHEMERLLPDAPSHDAARIVLALAYLRMGDREAARQLCDSASLSNLSSGHQAVYALVMNETDRPDKARNVSRAIPMQLLLEEEKNLILPILAKNSASNP